MALDTAFITISSLLTCFDFRPALDEVTGQPIEVHEAIAPGIVS